MVSTAAAAAARRSEEDEVCPLAAAPLVLQGSMLSIAPLPGHIHSTNGRGRHQLVPLRDVLGVSFEVNSDMMREEVDGRVTIVLKKHRYPTRYWRKWLGVLAQLTSLFISALYMLGPLSAMALLALMMALVITTTRREVAKSQLRRDGHSSSSLSLSQGSPRGGGTVSMGSISIPKIFCAATSGNLIAATLFWALKAIQSANSMTGGVRVACSVRPMTCFYTVIALYAGIYIRAQTNTMAMRVYQTLVHPMVMPLPPFYHKPIVVEYEEEQLQHLLVLRAQFYRSEDLRPFVWHYWVGNAAVESALSFCLPSTAYNSKLFRQFLFVALNYVVPIYSVMRGLGALLPFLGGIASVVQADIGLLAVKESMDHFTLRIYRMLAARREQIWAKLPRDIYILSYMSRNIFQPSIYYIMQTAKYTNSAIFNYILPNNIYMQYIQSQLVLLQIALGPIVSMVSGVIHGTWALLSPVLATISAAVGSIAGACSKLLTQPMPKPGVVAVAGKVVSGGSRLVGVISSPATKTYTGSRTTPPRVITEGIIKKSLEPRKRNTTETTIEASDEDGHDCFNNSCADLVLLELCTVEKDKEE